LIQVKGFISEYPPTKVGGLLKTNANPPTESGDLHKERELFGIIDTAFIGQGRKGWCR
jgi:hypothetical protein